MSLQYIIDGYNLLNHRLFTSPRKNNAGSPAKAILSFIREKNLTGKPKNTITIVFDGYPGKDVDAAPDPAARVVFSGDISADEKIKQLVERAANRKNVVVVSDDKELKFIVKSLGVRALGIEDFSGAEEKAKIRQKQERELIKAELSFSQMHKINQELSRKWLK